MRDVSTFLLAAISVVVVSTSTFASNDCRLEGYWLSNEPSERLSFGNVKSGSHEGEFEWRFADFLTNGKYAISDNGDQIHFIGVTTDTSAHIQKRFDATYGITMSPPDFPNLFTLKGDNPTVAAQDFHRNPSDPTDNALIASLCNP